jgi:DNA-binding SARP family transcriptional activator
VVVNAWRAAVCAPPASGVDCPRTFLGHLKHHVEPYRPQELRVMMSEVSLRRVEELLLGIANELRPTLAVGDPAMHFVDRGQIVLGHCDFGLTANQGGAPLLLVVRGPRWPRMATFPSSRWRYVSKTLPDLSSVGERTRVQLCGRLSVELDGVELAGSLRGRQVPLLLAYLVLNRERPVGREELIGALWPQTAPRSQDAAMRTLLSRLRSALGQGIVTGRDEVGLELPEPAWVDVEAAASEVWRAQRALDTGDARAAWALAQVPLNIASRGLLPGTQAVWLEPRRRELADIRLEALEVIGRAGLSLGGTQLGSVERAARTLIETEPYRESGYVLLMAALEAEGNVAEGLRVFEQLRSLLRDELGTMPSPEAMQAHERLLHPSSPGSAPGAARNGAGVSIELPAELSAAAAPQLVGRREEMARLEMWWRTPEGERVMLLAGDPGIGKTRLLAEIAVRAYRSGAIVLAGRAPEETVVPYQPFLEALGHYVFRSSLEDLRSVAREYGAELGRLIPALRRRLPELPRPDPGDPETDRYRLFEAVAGLLAAISASVPALIVLDDLQWADRPTLLLLRHLARSPHSTRVSIIGAYRAVDHWSEGFDAALAGLRRERLMVEMDVGGLGEDDAMELVRLRGGGTPSLAFVQALYRETEGNPFFIEEIVRHLADSGVRSYQAGPHDLEGVGLPEDVRDVISRRLERLEPATTEWLRVAAVIGRDFDGSLLERVLELDEEQFLKPLEEALDASLVTESPGERGRYSFSHALIRETLYEGMSAARRTRVHRRVGEALESDPSHPERQIGALALHFTRAAEPEDAERAIRYAVEAGAQATAMLANEEAAAHYGRALEVLERAEPDALRRRCELLLELGEARVRSGERPLAWATFREAAALAARLGDSDSLARAAIGASRRYVQPPGIVDEELIALLDQALGMTTDERTVTRITLLGRLCGALYFSDRRDEMRALSLEATAIAAELDTPVARALAAAARRRAYWGPGQVDRRLADSTLLLRAAREASDSELTLQGHAWLVVDLLESGDRTGVEVQMQAFAVGAERLRQPLYLWNAAVWKAMMAMLDGHLEEAEQLAAAAVSSGIRSEGVTAPQYYAVQLLAIRMEQDRMGELEAPARELVSTNPDRSAWRAGLATLLRQTGRIDAARAEFDVLARDGFTGITRDGDWMVVAALTADLAAGLGDAERSADLYDLLLPYAETNVVIGLGAMCLGSTHRYLGRLALTLGRTDDAIGHLRRAVDANTAMRAVIELAHAQIDLARALPSGTERQSLLALAEAVAAERALPLVARRAAELRNS